MTEVSPASVAPERDAEGAVNRMVAASLLAYVVLAVCVGFGFLLASGLACQDSSGTSGSQGTCAAGALVGGLLGVPVSVAALVVVGRRFGLRPHWVPSLIGFGLLLGMVSLAVSFAVRVPATLLLLLAPWLASLAAAPTGTPRRAKRLVGGLIAGVLVAATMGIGAQATAARSAKIAELTKYPVQLYAPIEAKPTLTISSPRMTGASTVTYYLLRERTHVAEVEINRHPDQCSDRCRRFAPDLYAVAYDVNPVYHRMVAEGSVAVRPQQKQSDEEMLQLLREMKPVSAEWLVSHS